MTQTVRALLAYGVERFEQAGLSYGHGTANALDEAAWLILHALGLPPTDLDSHLDTPLDAAQARTVKALLDRRVRSRKPAAYLINTAWLGPQRFYVDERVIVPRSFIAELLRPMGAATHSGRAPRNAGLSPAIAKDPYPTRSILDLCTGSGCLAILAALAFPQARVDAADLSDDALAVAARNVADYKLAPRVQLLKSDLFAALEGRTYDLIVSNPPYVKASSMRKLPDEYRREPEMALASGADGLDHTRVILAQARRHLNPGGRLLVEIGHNRKALERAYPSLAFEWPRTSGGRNYVFALTREQLP
jgi:ribosomal protein L3 glutamine methyltransferase